MLKKIARSFKKTANRGTKWKNLHEDFNMEKVSTKTALVLTPY